MARNLFRSGGKSLLGLAWSAVLLAALLAAAGARAESAYASSAAPHRYDAAELEQLVGPIALYVDDLVGIVLPAAAYPLQIVEAARFLDAREHDPALKPDDSWDDAVVALLNYPEVLRKMNDDLEWTAALGEAFVYQQSDVLDAIQRFRERVRYAGNLNSDEYQNVTGADGAIVIAPANPQVIYVPYYEPVRVVSYYAGPAYDYYPYGYPVYYYPYPVGYAFNSGWFWGVSTAFVVGWNTHHVHVCPQGYLGHPFYGHRYYDRYYVRNADNVDVPRNRYGDAWRPSERWGGRPRQQFQGQDGYAGASRPTTSDGRGSALTPATAFSPAWSGRTPQASGRDRGASASARTSWASGRDGGASSSARTPWASGRDGGASSSARTPWASGRVGDGSSLAARNDARSGGRTVVRTDDEHGNAADTRYRRYGTDLRGAVPARVQVERPVQDRADARPAPPPVRIVAQRWSPPAIAADRRPQQAAPAPTQPRNGYNAPAASSGAWRPAPPRDAGPASSGAAPRQTYAQRAGGDGGPGSSGGAQGQMHAQRAGGNRGFRDRP